MLLTQQHIPYQPCSNGFREEGLFLCRHGMAILEPGDFAAKAEHIEKIRTSSWSAYTVALGMVGVFSTYVALIRMGRADKSG